MGRGLILVGWLGWLTRFFVKTDIQWLGGKTLIIVGEKVA